MDRQYFKEFRKKMFRLHMAVAFLCVLVAVILLLFMDSFFNGVIIDWVEDALSWQTAKWVMRHEASFIMAFLCLVAFFSFFILERYFLAKMDGIFRNIGILFQKDDQFLELDQEFALLEQDLNQLKRENLKSEQLVQLETKRKLDLITYLAHDIKTPLASVIGYLCLLDETDNLPEEIRKKYTLLTLEKAYRLETLVNEFFEITRFNVGKIPLEKENINLLYMLEQLADEFYPMAEAGGRTILVDVREGLQIYADPDKIARVFNNILKNALAYGSKGSCIQIRAMQKDAGRERQTQPKEPKEKQAGVEICICNEGREIPKEQLEKIFEQFYRLDQARSSDTGGSGLGLAIAREIVREHGGSITADSERGRTTFTVWLPAWKEDGTYEADSERFGQK